MNEKLDEKYFCPNCGTEVKLDTVKCPKCAVEIVFEEENENEEKTTVIKTFTNEFGAQIAKGVLDEEGIESFISRDDAGSIYPFLQLTNGVDLHVFEKDKEKALEILDSMNK